MEAAKASPRSGDSGNPRVDRCENRRRRFKRATRECRAMVRKGSESRQTMELEREVARLAKLVAGLERRGGGVAGGPRARPPGQPPAPRRVGGGGERGRQLPKEPPKTS